MRQKNWAEIRKRKTKELVMIVYNPYHKTKREILKDWVPGYGKDCYVIFTSFNG